MESHTRAKSLSEHPGEAVAQYPWGAALGALDLIADVSFSGASMWFCFYLSAWSLDWDFFFFFYYHCYYLEREGWLFCAQCRYAVGVLFLPHHDVALLLRDEGHGSPSEAVAGDGCHSEGPGQGLMSAFYILGAEPQAHLHVVFHGLPLSHTNSLTRMLAHRWCGGK